MELNTVFSERDSFVALSLKDFSLLPPDGFCPPSTLCLGTFDGVHIAHRELFLQTVSLSRIPGEESIPCAFCFAFPPSDYLSDQPPAHLSDLRQKLLFMKQAGIQRAYIADFPSIKALSPSSFIEDVLQKQLHCVQVVCGYNFRFGANGEGSPELLTRYFHQNAHILEPKKLDGSPVSSSSIREMIRRGDLREATRFLGHDFSFFSSWGTISGCYYFLVPKDFATPPDGSYSVRISCRGEDLCLIGTMASEGAQKILVFPPENTALLQNLLKDSEAEISFNY